MRSKRALVNAVVVAATVAVLPATIAALWASGWYSRTAYADVVEASGTIEGRVVGVDFQTRTIRLNTSRFGFKTLPIVATTDMRVFVGDKEGSLRDLYAESLWRIAYERRDTGLVALCAEFVNPQAGHAESACRTSPQSAALKD